MPLATNLISYYSLDEASGNALDAHSSNDLTDNNTVGSTTGIIGNARDLEAGNGEYFSHTDNTDLSTGDIDFTIAGWCSNESVPGGFYTIASKHDGASIAGSEFLLAMDSSGRLNFTVYQGSSNFTTVQSAIVAAQPIFFVAWHDSVNNEIGIRLANNADVTASCSHGVNDTTEDFRLGAVGSGSPLLFDGWLDEIGFWKRVLTSGERDDLYNSGAGRDYAYITGGAPAANANMLMLLGVG